ncbi:MAG: OmpA family protein, partial [Bacteroidales bacterium]
SLNFVQSLSAASEFDLKKLNPKNWVTAAAPVQEKTFEEEKGIAIGGKQGDEIKSFMLKQAQKLKSIKGAVVSTIRNGEVVKVSLPASLLFLPNDTVLMADAETVLRPVLTFMRKDLTKLLITGHSDNTGRKEYIQQIAQYRATAVEEWFQRNGVTDGEMAVFSFADSKPLYDNDSMVNRAKNRRVTLYLVPNTEMIKLAKRKRLNK